MKDRKLFYASILVIMVTATFFSASPVQARPGEVTIIVKDVSTKQLVGDNVLIFIGTADLRMQYTLFTNDGKVKLSDLGNPGDTFLVGEPEGGSYVQIDSFTIHHNGGARITVYVNPLN